MNKGIDRSKIASFILIFAFILANLRALVFIFLFPDTSKPFGAAWIEIMLWALAFFGILYILYRDNQMKRYMAMWQSNLLITLFILLAFVSILWSVAPVATSFRILELFFATLIASCFGMRLNPERMMQALFWFGAILFILSIGLVYGAPPTGTMYWMPFNGAWRGIYWHRNHLASIAALLNAVYLIRILIAIQNRNRQGLLDVFFYLFSLIILYFAKSATGFILWIILNLFVWAVWAWLQLSDRLKKWHYFLLIGLGAVITILILSNLSYVFALFKRSPTLTGRTPLWGYLLEVASQRLWTGHGFGALWTLEAFRKEVMDSVNWGSQPLIADNGFIDIYLHLGIVGLMFLTSVLILVAVRSVRYAIAQKTLAGFFPLLVLVYAVFANITFSLFAETEVFVWFLIVASLFVVTLSSEQPVA